jgi:hypothetical protein
MILTPRIASVLHVFSLKPHSIGDKCLQGHPRSMTSHTFPFNLCHKTVHRNSLNSLFRLTPAFCGLSFSFVVYGFDLLVKVLFVFIVLVSEDPGLLW